MIQIPELDDMPQPIFDGADIVLSGAKDEYGNLSFLVVLTRGGEPITQTAHTAVFSLYENRPFTGGQQNIQTTGADDLGMTLANVFGNPSGLMQCIYRGAPLAGQINDVGSGEWQVGAMLPDGGVALSNKVYLAPPPPPA